MNKISYILGIFLLCSCASFQTAVLVEDKPLAQQDSATMNAPTKPVMGFSEGYLFNAKTDISKWEASHANTTVGKKEGQMVVSLNGVGQNWEQLSRKFQPLNFTETGYILVKARVDIASPDSLKMRIDLIDDEGIMTNYSPQEHYIRSKENSKVYKFIYDSHWEQGWPSRKVVDQKRISEIRINFNGGAVNYSGKLFIEEIVVSDGKNKIENPNNFALFDFADGVSGWWNANSIGMSADDSDGNEVMKLDMVECGPAWEGIGYKFNYSLDFIKTPIVKVRVKATAAGKLRLDLNDIKDYSTNATPLLIDFPASNEYVDLFFDFTGKFKQSWPNTQEVDASQIRSVKFHVNPPENPAYTGTVLIDEIVLMSIEEFQKISK